jgi:integrase
MTTIKTRTWTNKNGGQETAYQVDFLDENARRKRRQFKLKRQANQFVESLTDHRNTGTLAVAVSGIDTFGAAAEAFLEACRIGRDGGAPLERSTIQDYRYRLERQVIPLLGATQLRRISHDDIEAVRDALLASGLNRRSVRQDLAYAKAVLDYAVSRRMLQANPATGVKLKMDKRRDAVSRKQLSIHTREEMGAILAAAKAMKLSTGRLAWMGSVWLRFEVMLHTLVYAGLRMSELRGLPVDSLNYSSHTIRIYQRADRWGDIGNPKSVFGVRTIHIPEETSALLAAWRGSRSTGLMFPTDSGRPISHPNLAQRMWRRAQEKAGVTILHPHAARHFYASMMIDQGMRLKALQESLGHHDPMFTLRTYGHLFRDPEDVAMRAEMAGRMRATLEDED